MTAKAKNLGVENTLLITLLLWLGYVVLSLLYPWKHSPDGNVYYLVALNLWNGNLSGAFESAYSPLLSWLLVPLISLDIPLPWGYRIINILAAGIFLFASRRILSLIGGGILASILALILSTVQIVFVTLNYTTPDLLAAALSLVVIQRGIENRSGKNSSALGTSLLLALIFYAKAFQIVPVTIAYLLITRQNCKRGILTTGLAILFSAPLITAISIKNERFTVSGQQFISTGSIALEYSPASKAAVEDSFFKFIEHTGANAFSKSISSARYLYESVTATVFDVELFWAYLLFIVLGIVMSQRYAFRSVRIGFPLIQIACLLPIWGGRLRYYIAIFPLLNLLAMTGAELLLARVRGTKSGEPSRMRLVVATALLLLPLLFIQRNASLLAESWGSTRNATVERIAAMKEIAAVKGPLAAGELEDPYPSLIASVSLRPLWLYTGLHLSKSPAEIRTLLAREKVSQIIFSGKVRGELAAVEGVSVVGTYKVDDYEFTLYDVK